MTRQEQINRAVAHVRRNNMNRGNFNNFTAGVAANSSMNAAPPPPNTGVYNPSTGTIAPGSAGPMPPPSQAGTRLVNLSGVPKHYQAQFTLTCNNNVTAGSIFQAGSIMPIEFFYNQNSCSTLGNNVNALIPTAIPLEGSSVNMSATWATATSNPALTTGYIMKAIAVTGVNAAGWLTPQYVYTVWDVSGNLNFCAPTSGYTTLLPTVTLGCRETSYRSLFNFAGVQAFNTTKIKMFLTNAIPQTQNQLLWARATFTGGVTKNPTSPQNSFSEYQLNNNIVGVNGTWKIDREKGFLYGLNMNEGSDAFVFSCDLWTESDL